MKKPNKKPNVIKKNNKLIALIVIPVLCVALIMVAAAAITVITSLQDFTAPVDRCDGDSPCMGPDKPIIYLYPTEPTEITVQTSHPENFTAEYPRYVNGWRVKAEPDGSLVDLNTGQELYALYYESKNIVPARVTSDGFVVKGLDTSQFLEEKLTVLGLNARETEEFIIYWLPQMEKNQYNYIRFQTIDEINQNMRLDITPRPDTLIRVLMAWRPLDAPIAVTEQRLEPATRNGYTAVEWGGVIIGAELMR
ncbi:MAG: hypothetical protein LBC95_02925 [Candidatus Nomurabacteria bacterium]|nr:hypothetical protein [Candidatus Nomurabacteria bacterium]